MPDPQPKAKLVERSQEPRWIPKCLILSEQVNISVWVPSDKDSWKDEERKNNKKQIKKMNTETLRAFWKLTGWLIQLNSILFISIMPFTIKLSLGTLQRQKPRAETPREAQWPPGKLPFNRKKPRAGPCLQRGTVLLKAGWAKEEKKRETGQRE